MRTNEVRSKTPWYRHLAASTLIAGWNAWGALAYRRTRKKERSQAFHTFCSENELEASPDLEAALHRNYRLFERINARLVIGTLLMDFTQLESIYQSFRILGQDILENFRDRGAILVSYHLGPFSQIPFLLCRMGFTSKVLARGDEVKAATGRELSEVNRILLERQAAYGYGQADCVDAQATLSLIQIKKALNRKEFLLIFPDTAKSSSISWAPLPILQQEFAGHLGLAKLLQMTRAELIHLVTYWDDQGRPTLQILGPCPYQADAPSEELLKAIYGPFEQLLLQYLSQWIQVHSYEELKLESKE